MSPGNSFPTPFEPAFAAEPDYLGGRANIRFAVSAARARATARAMISSVPALNALAPLSEVLRAR